MRHVRLLLILVGLVCPLMPAQTIQLGNSLAVLSGPWKFTPGDSPLVNGQLAWAQPTFDDAAWTSMDLRAVPGEIDAAYGSPGYITGWSARGFPNLAGYAWYRLRIHVAPNSPQLWIKMPDHTDDSYQLFANGQYVGEFGHFTATGVDNYRSRVRTFPLPAPDAQGDMELAVRFYMEPFVLAGGTTGDSGGMHQAPVVGLSDQIEALRTQAVTGRIMSLMVSLFVSFMLLIAAVGAFWIWLLDRPHTTYLWLTLGLALSAVSAPLLAYALFSYTFTQDVLNATKNLSDVALLCWIMFWSRWFYLPKQRWLYTLTIALTVLVLFAMVFSVAGVTTNQTVIVNAMRVRAAANLALGVMLLVALWQGARRDRAAALTALVPILLLLISLFSIELLNWFHIRTSAFPFGVQVSVQDVAFVLLLLVIGALVARRFVNSQVAQRLERQSIDQDLEQASELQQRVLIPEPITSALFTVENAYYPARTVGGDFFQVIAHPDGSLLVVVGDVSGKGMAAAMLVAVLVGAVRTRADETFDPAAILHTLNGRLLGRAGDHFATCVVAHIRPGGIMRVANAGHLPPYRNGVAMELPGSLPLGIIPETHYDVFTVQLAAADQLTFLTDGVPEARNATGELLGFERLAAMASQTPESIAAAAMAHGQDDDMTIVSVRLRSEMPAYQQSRIDPLAAPSH